MHEWTDYCGICGDHIHWFTRSIGWQHFTIHDHEAVPTHFGPNAPRTAEIGD